MSEKEKRGQVTKISVFITSIFVIFISISYAFINQTLTGTKKQVITAGNLELELHEGELITLANALPMYDEVGMIQKEFTFILTNKTMQDTNYILRLKDVTGEDKQRLDTTLVRYGLIKDGAVGKDSLSKLKDNVLDSGKIKGNQTIHYSLRLWIDSGVEDETQIKDKSLSYQIEVKAKQDIPGDPNSVEVKLFVHDNLGENCKTYDDGMDTFLVGQCNQNYVWYSGKLWRVVLRNNETGAVKMVTDNAITAISYNADGNTAFENSYVDQWLNQEFLPTLHDYEDYLVVDSVWDATLDGTGTPSRPVGTTLVTRTVGLLNAYEYYTTYNKSDGLATSGTGYLMGVVSWLMTPYNTSREVFATASGGDIGALPLSRYALHVRPAINLKESILITSGNGTKTEPYKLEGDSSKINNGTTLLSTRYSGEYVTFNNELYRIVAVENNLTKIIAVDSPKELTSSSFDDNRSVNFEKSSIKDGLETYYQNNIAEPYKFMVEPSQTWYLGAVGDGTNYKASICRAVDSTIAARDCPKTTANTVSNIGLPRAGEMFTSLITRGTQAHFWTLTPYNDSRVQCINSVSMGFYDPRDASSIRPSMYLKSNVVISKENTGDGTYEHPYDIELSP